MGWVRKTDPPRAHECNPPVEESVRRNHDDRIVDYLMPRDAHRGDLWRCDDCQKLWQVIEWNVSNGDNYLDWEPASFWNRWKYPAPKRPWPKPTTPLCRCGHAREAHRERSDLHCSACKRPRCTVYLPLPIGPQYSNHSPREGNS